MVENFEKPNLGKEAFSVHISLKMVLVYSYSHRITYCVAIFKFFGANCNNIFRWFNLVKFGHTHIFFKYFYCIH